MAARVVRPVRFLFRKNSCFQHNKQQLTTEFYTTKVNTVIRLSGPRPLCTSTTGLDETEVMKPPKENLFASPIVQELLVRITGYNPERIFKAVQKPLRRPAYKFMTDAELEQAREGAKRRGLSKLQMPPYIRSVERPPKVVSKDPEIQGLLSHNLICIDISSGLQRRFRTIVVRQPDGLLRDATNDERIRTSQVYYPMFGREISIPSMFHPENLKNVLDQGEYLFVLDRACRQFEPYDPEYTRVTETAFKHINKMKKYDVLRSSRHFGPMSFFLVLDDNIEGLMVDMIQRLLVDDALDLVQLYCHVHRPERWTELNSIEDKKKLLKVFATEDCKRTGELGLVVQSLIELSEKEKAVN